MWDELGIPETRDLKSIRKAYAARLKLLNRTGDDQAFARLHIAYQQAVARSEARAHAEAGAESRTVILRPIPPQPDAPVLDVDQLATLGTRIQGHLDAGKFQEAIDAYDQGLARGILPLGGQNSWHDLIMEAAVRNLEPEAFIALIKRVGWFDPPRWGSPATSVRLAAASRLEAEIWYINLRHEAGGGGLWLTLRGSPVRYWTAAAVRHRYLRRNAKLLVVDRPQLVRIVRHAIADLAGKLALYQRHKQWLGTRIPDRCIRRAERILAFDARWGVVFRKTIAGLAILAGIAGCGALLQRADVNPVGGFILTILLILFASAGFRFFRSLWESVSEILAEGMDKRSNRFWQAVFILVVGGGITIVASWYWQLDSNAIAGMVFTIAILAFFTAILHGLKKLWRRLRS